MTFQKTGLKGALALAAMATTFGAAGTSATAQELRFMCGSDGDTCKIQRDIMARFEAENPGVTIVLDAVPYKAILENLPVQLAAGNGPDIAGVTDLGGLNKYYLDLAPYVDADYWNKSFGDVLNWYRAGPEDAGIYGLHTQLTVTGGYINKTLFDQAGVEVPAKGATWEDWAAASRKVAEATGVEYPMAMDRSGHRIAGPAISAGAKLFAEDGTPMLVDEGFTKYVQKFVDWHEDGTMAREVWAGSGGSSYQDAANEFINGQVVYYYSGSWQVGKFDDQIGDFFDWQVVGSPCGDGGCSGMPGGSGLVGFKDTEHPKLVAKLIDFMAQDANYAEMADRTRNIPAHVGVIAKGVDYEGASAPAAAALNGWGAALLDVSPVAFVYQGHPQNRAMFNITVQRVTQAIVGELSVADAMERAKEDLAAVLAETQ